MGLIIETGSGVRKANSYVPISYVTAYLTERNRQTENSWSTATTPQQEASLIAATSFLENKYRSKFLGKPKYTFTESFATGKITFSGLPVADETLSIGDETYKFVSSLTGASNEVLIGADSAATAQNLKDVIEATTEFEGLTFGLSTEANRHVTVELTTNVLTLTCISPGDSGVYTVLSGTVTNVSLSAFSGGRSGGLQSLSWPREYAYDISGNLIEGIPENIKQAISEYTVRALTSSLQPDPSVDAYGGSITRRYEKVGPIEEEVVYAGGTLYKFSFPPYPAADELLKPLLRGYNSGGSVIRG